MGNLRTAQAKSVADFAKEIVKQWKTEVDKAKGVCFLFLLEIEHCLTAERKSKKQHQPRLRLLLVLLSSLISPLVALVLRRLTALKVVQEIPHAISVSSSSMMHSWVTQLLVRLLTTSFTFSFCSLFSFLLVTELVLTISRDVEKSALRPRNLSI